MSHQDIAVMHERLQQKRRGALHPSWAWLHLILLSCFFTWPTTLLAQAVCYYEDAFGNPINAPAAPQTVTFDSVNITLSSSPAAGSKIGSPRSATASGGTIYLNCPNTSTPGGLQPSYGTYDVTRKTIYSPTPGVAFQILRSGTAIPLYPNGPISGANQFTNTTTFQLISTGELPSNGSQIPQGTILGEWRFDNVCIRNPQVNGNGKLQNCGTNATTQTVIVFQSGGVTFTSPTCSVSTGSQNQTVTLPTITVSALGAVGATAGTTRFGINLTGCSSGLAVRAKLDSSNASTAATGVIAPTTGTAYASGVGVQILQSDGMTPVTFGTSFATGSTNGANSDYTFNLYARYYQTDIPVTPGQVQANATYTLTYQ